MTLSNQLLEELVLADLDIKVIVTSDDDCNGFICFPQRKASKLKAPKTKTYAGLYIKLIKRQR
jgi:hypothetical protein